ncbi:MAG: D-alanyl-D-alanine carboxypeptidase/D-alanyl-D-alanine-endopeptidase [Chlamydiae bacterium]|nr:D-alanyl-D-alanine carboxypeptidase/D-alanyl-D-alanine-endopeptidase [Chlamydiota bacterium]
MLRKIALSITLVSCTFLSQSFVYATNSKSKNTIKVQSQDFSVSIGKLVNLCEGQANVGIKIVSLKSGQTLYEQNANKLFLPASSLKAFTAGAALSMLGPQYRLKTSVCTDGVVQDGVVQGNLYLKGGGNPELSEKDLESLVFTMKLQGIHSIKGKVYVDSSEFDAISQGPGWMWDDEPEYWNSPMSALTVNHSCLQVWVCPAEECNAPAKILVYPKTSFVSIDNSAKTTDSDKSNVQLHRNYSQVRNFIKIGGTVAKNSEPTSHLVALQQPQLFAGNVFVDLLKKNNINLSSTILEAKIPLDVTLLAEHESSPVADIIKKMMKESDNLFADCLFKKIGQIQSDSIGTWGNGSKAVREFLSGRGLNPQEMVVLDGSGLSRYNLVTPSQFVEFLVRMKKDFSFSEEFVSSLSVSGVDGNLRKAMDEKVLYSKVRAKTGSMRGVRTLVGYTTTAEGEDLALAIMINGFIGTRDPSKKLENEICKFLVEYKRK